MKRIRIFISSVQSEFAEERAMLGQYIRTDALLGKFFEIFLFEDICLRLVGEVSGGKGIHPLATV